MLMKSILNYQEKFDGKLQFKESQHIIVMVWQISPNEMRSLRG